MLRLMLSLLLCCTLHLPAATPDIAALQDLAVDLPRPRLLLPADMRALRKHLGSDPILAAAYGRLLQTSAGMLQEEEPLQRVMKGQRMLGSSRLALRRILHGALAYRLSGQPDHLALAKRAMLAAADFRDWNPRHFLDVGEMCAALAIGYDWLHDALTPEERDRIAQALIDKGLGSIPKDAWWLATTNNWNQVCHGGLALAAIAIWEREPELAAATLHRALQRIPITMHEYGPDGAYAEGPTYWRYGTSYNVLFLEALRSAFGTDFGLIDAAPGFLRSATFYLHSAGTSGRFFNYGDANVEKSWRPSVSMYWFARYLDQPALLWRERELLAAHVRSPIATDDKGFRLFPLLLLWASPLHEIPTPETTAFTGAGTTPVSLQRGSWTDPATGFVGLKGGSPGHNHAHMDIGSFVYDRHGLRWGMDLGKVSYGAVEGHGIDIWDRSQDGGRWRLQRHNNRFHSTLLVDDRLQRVDGSAPIIAHAHEDGAGHAIVDMGSVYSDCLAGALRGVRLAADGDLLVQDEVQADGQDRSLRWAMVTPADVEILDPRRARLSRDGHSILAVIQEPAAASWEIVDISQPALPFEPANPDTRMLVFSQELTADAEARLIVRLETGTEDQQQPVVPLEDW